MLVVVLLVIIGFVLLSDSSEEIDGGPTASIWGDEMLGIDSDVDEALQGYRNILIFGLDAKQRSDIIMVASINKETNDVKVFSVYRDTYMQLNDEKTYSFSGGSAQYDFFKCNHAYFKGNATVAVKEFNRHLDMNSREYIGLDWAAISELVDEIGGIDVNVSPVVQSLTGGKIKHSGLQTLNGEQAVAYLRVRKDATAVQRSERNQEVLMQVFRKVTSMSKSEQLEIFDTIQDEIETNMSTETMHEMLKTVSDLNVESCDGWPYDYDVLWQDDNSFYYYVPDTLESNVIELHKNIWGQSDYSVSSTVKNLSSTIIKNKEEKVVR